MVRPLRPALNNRDCADPPIPGMLGIHAFHTVLSRKAHVYPQILKHLEFDLSLPQYRHFKKRFRAVTKEGLEMFTMLAF